jgi:hypothetical protein
MLQRTAVLVLAGAAFAASAACGPEPDLATALKAVPGITGYRHGGVDSMGQHRLLPSITFQLKNDGDVPMTYVDINVSFWREGDATEQDSKLIKGITSTPLAPGTTGDSITVDASIGYTSPVSTEQAFTSVEYKPFIVKLFAKRRGRTTLLGEYPVDQRVLPAAQPSGSQQ